MARCVQRSNRKCGLKVRYSGIHPGLLAYRAASDPATNCRLPHERGARPSRPVRRFPEATIPEDRIEEAVAALRNATEHEIDNVVLSLERMSKLGL